jgi:hypothetical protein
MMRRLRALCRRLRSKRAADTSILNLYALHEEYRASGREQTPRAFEVFYTERMFGRNSEPHRDAVARYQGQ